MRTSTSRCDIRKSFIIEVGIITATLLGVRAGARYLYLSKIPLDVALRVLAAQTHRKLS